jgi:hypothetical protein
MSTENHANEKTDDSTESEKTEASIVSSQVHTDPNGEGVVTVSAKGEGAVSLSITEGEPEPFGYGTGTWAFLNLEEARAVLDDLEDAVATAEELQENDA